MPSSDHLSDSQLRDSHLKDLADTLEASGEYRVLRKLQSVSQYAPEDGSEKKRALYVDVETTGRNPQQDEVIELAMVPFTYSQDGRIFSLEEPFQALREPTKPIPAEITAITGIDDAMVAGCRIDPAEVEHFMAEADLIIAHNASFDRRFLERFCPAFMHKPWACSMSQIDWKGEGFEGQKLVWLAAGAGFFYEKHRAIHDCRAGIELLARPLPKSGEPGLRQLLARARTPEWRIFATGAPYDLKDVLKARGYRWNGDASGAQRAWFIDIEDAKRDAECHFLQTEIYRRDVDVHCLRIDAFDRFSDRI